MINAEDRSLAARGEADNSATADREARLIALCRAGDADSYAELVLLHQDAIYNTLYRLLGNSEDARDAAQETFLKAYRSLRRFRGESRFATWLYRIAVNTALSARRRRKSAPRIVSLSSAPRSGDGALDPPAEAGEASEAAAMSEQAEMAQRALMRLEEEQRRIIVLHDVNGCSYAEIAEILGCASGTVKSRLHRARMSLRRVFARSTAEQERNA